MKKIGILGGMSPESTVLYYEHITRAYTARFGDYGYPEILICSVNFQKFVNWQHNGQWDEAIGEMAGALERLRLAGADFGLIATNTMHIVFDEVQRAVRMPLLSIVEVLSVIRKRSFLSLRRCRGCQRASSAPKARSSVNHQHQNIPAKLVLWLGRR